MDANGIEYQKREKKKMKTITLVKNRLIQTQGSQESSTQFRMNLRKTFK